MGNKAKLLVIGLLVSLVAASVDQIFVKREAVLEAYLPGAGDSQSWSNLGCPSEQNSTERCKSVVGALEGSGSAAMLLAEAESERESRLFWLEIAAQNGDAKGVQLYADALGSLPAANYSTAGNIRADFWRRIANLDTSATKLTNGNEAISSDRHYELPSKEDRSIYCGSAPWWAIFDVRRSMNSGMNLSCEEAAKFQRDALSGNSTAALRMLNFFSGIQAAFTPKVWPDQLYWATICAENGEAADMYALGVYLAHKTVVGRPLNPLLKIRGKFWLSKAASRGHEDAAVELKSVDETAQ